jgi:AcrR family transcriptional regulator
MTRQKSHTDPVDGRRRRQLPPGVTSPPTRADARRNFQRLLSAAEEVLQEFGTDASLDEIARRANLGSGTLYRHFPNRDALLTAVFWDRVEELCDLGDRLVEAAEPDSALIRWLRALVGLTMQRGLAAALMAGPGGDAPAIFTATRQALEDTAVPLLRRAQRHGRLRADLTASELVTFAHAIAMCASLDADRDRAADRLLELLADGFWQH